MTRPRHWFQIHLSTAVVVMLVAAFLLYLNLVLYADGRCILDGGGDFSQREVGILVDVAVGVVLLLMTAVAFEYLIRRRTKTRIDHGDEFIRAKDD